MQVKIGMSMMKVGLCHLGGCDWEPVLIGIGMFHIQEIAK